MVEIGSELLGTETQTPQNWFPDEYKEIVSQKGWDAGKFLKSYTELESALGSRAKVPTDESTPEERSAFYTKIGRPDTPDGYAMPTLPEDKSYDESLVGGMKTMAFEEGWTDKQWKSAVERYLAIETQTAEKQDAENVRQKEETDRTLREQWGAEYDKNLEITRRAFRELVPGELGEQFAALIEDSGFGNNLIFLQAFREIGSKMLDDTLVRGEGQVAAGEKEYVPSHPHSPEMYKNAEDDEGKKARAYFEKRGHRYD